SAKLILDPRRPWLIFGGKEIVIRVQNSVAQIFIRFAMDQMRAGFRAQVDNSARKLSPCRPKIAGLNPELLKRIMGWYENLQINVADIKRLSIYRLCTLIAERSIHLVIAPTKRI